MIRYYKMKLSKIMAQVLLFLSFLGLAVTVRI